MWQVTRIEVEENDGAREQVSRNSLVWDLMDDFGGHEGRCANLLMVEALAMGAREWGSEAKVCDFQIAFGVEKDVLRLEIPMGEAPRVHVMDRHHQLLEVIAARSFVEGARVLDVVLQLAAKQRFLSNVGDRSLRTIPLRKQRCITRVPQLDNMLVIQTLQR